MSLILAIEPDPQQSARLTDLVRRRLSADLVHATTTEGALAALARVGDRVPDLVLVPSLLSAHEDAAIAGALRVIAAAANVRMLTIPLLADPEQPAPAQGMLARLRGKKPKVTPGGCDPEVFADQIATYLAEAAAERKAKREELEELRDISPVAAPLRQPAPEPEPEPFIKPESIIEPEPVIAAEPEVKSEPIAEPEPIVPLQTYKPMIIQPIIVAHDTDAIGAADSWPDRSGDAMREIASVSEPPQSDMFDAPIVAAVGESVIVPAEPAPIHAIELHGQASPNIQMAAPAVEPEPVVVASDPIVVAPEPIAVAEPVVVVASEPLAVAPEPAVVTPEPTVVTPEPTVVASQPQVVEHESVVAALLQSLAAPAAVPESAAVPEPAAVPEQVQAAPTVHPEPVPAPAASIETLPTPVSEMTPAVTREPRSEEVKARFWGSRIRIPKVVAKLVEPKRIEAPIEAPAAAAAAIPEPVAAISVAPAVIPEPVVEISAAPAQEAKIAEEAKIVEQPRINASKSRIRIPKQSGVRKPKPKPAPRDDHEEIDIDALIAPLLTEMAARRTTADPKPVDPPPVPVPEPVLATAPPTPDVDPMFFADDAMTVPPPTPAQAERSAWIELVESLRQDIERLKADREQPAAPPAPVEESAPSLAAKTVSSIRRRPAAPVVQMPNPASRVSRTQPRKPVQDQWGLFDPEQCGFAALLAKLDEIGARDEASA